MNCSKIGTELWRKFLQKQYTANYTSLIMTCYFYKLGYLIKANFFTESHYAMVKNELNFFNFLFCFFFYLDYAFLRFDFFELVTGLDIGDVKWFGMNEIIHYMLLSSCWIHAFELTREITGFGCLGRLFFLNRIATQRNNRTIEVVP